MPFPNYNTYLTTAPLNDLLIQESSELLPASSIRLSSASTIVVTRTSGTILSIANGSSTAAPQTVRFNPRTRQITAATTLTISSGTGTGRVDIYGTLSNDTTTGTLTFTVLDTSGNVFTGGTGVSILEATGTQPQSNWILLWSWSITSGAFDSTNKATGANPSGPIGDQQLSTDAWVDCIEAANTTGSTVTLLFEDGQGTAIQLFPTANLAANTVVSYVHPGGRYFDGGLWITAGTANAVQVNVRLARIRRSQLIP